MSDPGERQVTVASHFQVVGIWRPEKEKCNQMDENKQQLYVGGICLANSSNSENYNSTLNLTSCGAPVLTQLEWGDKRTGGFNSHHLVAEFFPLSFKIFRTISAVCPLHCGAVSDVGVLSRVNCIPWPWCWVKHEQGERNYQPWAW